MPVGNRVEWRPRAWLAAALAATGLGLLFAVQIYLVQRRAGRADAFWVASRIQPQLIPWYVWACLTPLVMRGVGQIAARALTLPARALAYGALAALSVLAHAALTALALGWWWSFPSAVPTDPAWHFVDLLRTRGAVNLVAFIALAAGCLAVRQQRVAHERALASAHLETRLVEAELRALRAQLEPHFLFNTLNAIGAYVRPAPEVAEAMVARLADVLRSVVGASRRQETTLRDELALARSYLEIHRVRFGARLAVEWQVEEAALDLPAPPLVLQPIIENAIRHGVETRVQATRLTVAVALRGDVLSVDVTDGPAVAGSLSSGTASLPEAGLVGPDGDGDGDGGIGLANTRARMELLFGDRYDLRLNRSVDDGTTVHLEWPARWAPAAVAAAVS